MSPTPTDPNQAQAWITGDPPDQTIDFYIPRGNTGPMGPVGPQGPSLVVGSVETNMGPAAPGTVGPQGATGPKGDPGGFTSGAVLGTTDLNLIVTAGLYKQDNSTNATLVRNYPRDVTGGVLVVYERVAPGASASVIQHFLPAINSVAGSSVSYTRYSTTNNTTWTPWRAYASSRVDQTAGRAIYQWDVVNDREQLIWGDTGWRELAVTPVTGKVVSGNVRYRRRGWQVELRFVDVLLDTSVNGFTDIIAASEVPLGFRPLNGVRNMQPIGIQNNAVNQQWITVYGAIGWTHTLTSGVYSAVRPSTSLLGTVIWNTEDTWPTSLPGIAAGAIPNA